MTDQPLSGVSILWDLDGTLLDSYEEIVSGVQEVCRSSGIETDRKTIEYEVRSASVSAFFRILSEKTGIPAETLKQRYEEEEHRRSVRIPLFEGAEETLKELSCLGAKHYVYSHRGRTSFDILKRTGILPAFAEIVTAEDGFARKPAGDAVLYLVRKYGMDKRQMYYVGDRTIDMNCAENAGIPGILFLPLGSVVTPDGTETCIIRHLRDLRGLLLQKKSS